MKPVVLLCALLVSASSFGVDYIYKWTDDQAEVHYTQTPPRDRPFERLRGDTARSDEAASGDEAAPASAIDANRAFLEKAEKANTAEAEAKAKQAGVQAQLDARCKQAREMIAALDSSIPHRTAKVDANGEVSRMTEEDFAQRRDEAQKAIADSCH